MRRAGHGIFVDAHIGGKKARHEFALVAVDRAQVGVRASKNERPWPTVQKLLSELSFHLSAAQVGITISSLIFGFIAAALIIAGIEWMGWWPDWATAEKLPRWP